MNEVEAAIEIDAPVDVVWTVLTDFEQYSEWNPYITAASGAATEGSRVEIRLTAQGGRTIRLAPQLDTVIENEVLEWSAQYLAPRLFHERHTIELEPSDDAETRVVQRVSFTGISADQMFSEASIRDGIEAMNQALKERTESLVVL
ncbi:SRPBCC domain-containing protein [Haloarchaeobius sp. HME9146]|uniref:SRPBCC domain-containing protein n=1 Tax=Haloarchaeobius sp. HME9146 TaxID=2978732 RepID=UPI0021C13A01|nr:SRPBCC domain-containing protein [Haloarchaeobius sp. HME9146]MCT9094910.1 SRPBCC domain-containing protein [Haloarchaeobius sp. HME9146]